MNMKINVSSFQAIAAATVMAIATISTTSCSKSDVINNTDPVQAAVNILPTVSNATAGTRADAAYAKGSIFLYYGNVGSAQTATFTYGSAWTSNDPLYWNDLVAANNEYKFFALAPAVPTATPAVTEDQSAAESLAANDQLVAYCAVNTPRATLPLIFKHVLSQIKVELTAGVESSHAAYIDPASATLSIKGAKTGYTMAYTGATVAAPATATATTGEATSIMPLTGATGTTREFLTILPPQTFDASALKLSFSIAAKTYTWSNADAITIAAGQNLTIQITVTKTGVNLLANGITVGNWTDATLTDQTVTIEGITSGNGTGNLTPTESDKLKLITGSTAADYTFGTAWTSVAPIYWNNLPAGNSVFTALYTPTAGEVGVKDYLKGGATVAFGKPINLSLTHAMSKVKIVLEKGTGNTELSEITSRVINLKGFKSIADDGTVTTNSTVAGIDFVSGTEQIVSPQAITSANTIVLTRGDGGHKYTLDLSTVQVNGAVFTALVPNTSYTITITVDDTEATISATVAAWDTASGGGSAT